MPSSPGDASPDQINMIGEGTVFEGTLRAESNVRVSGHIQGKLDVKGRAIITQEGVVEGELHATDADVAGSVQGEIHVAERLMLKSTARIDGNIASGRIKVEEGALFAGQCEIGEKVSERVEEQIGGKGGTRASDTASATASAGASPPSSPGGSSSQKNSAKGTSAGDDSSGGKRAPKAGAAQKSASGASQKGASPKKAASNT